MQFHFIYYVNQACIITDTKVVVSCSVVKVQDIVVVPHFFACSWHQPQRLKAPFVRTGHVNVSIYVERMDNESLFLNSVLPAPHASWVSGFKTSQFPSVSFQLSEMNCFPYQCDVTRVVSPRIALI